MVFLIKELSINLKVPGRIEKIKINIKLKYEVVIKFLYSPKFDFFFNLEILKPFFKRIFLIHLHSSICNFLSYFFIKCLKLI